MDDYKVILGMEFTLLIFDKDKTCMVSMDRETKQTMQVLSTIQLREHYLGNKFSKKYSKQLEQDRNKPYKASKRRKQLNKGLNKRA